MTTFPKSPIAQIGLGCVTFGREIDEAASFALMDHAVTYGIGLFDTAAAYAQGKSETIVGAWLRRRVQESSRPMVVTKILPPYRPETIESAVTESAQRLGVKTIDGLFLHRWDESLRADDALIALDRLVQTQRVRTLGLSNFAAPQLENLLERQRTLGLVPVQFLQNIHNFAVRGFDSALLALCRRANLQTMAYSPLGAGFLTGKHQHGVEPGSRFAVIPAHQNIYFNDQAQSRLARLQAVAASSGRTTTQLALAWALHQPEIDFVLIGGRHLRHVDQALAAQAREETGTLAQLSAE